MRILLVTAAAGSSADPTISYALIACLLWKASPTANILLNMSTLLGEPVATHHPNAYRLVHRCGSEMSPPLRSE